MTLRAALLGLLATQPATGYSLKRRLDQALPHIWPASQSQIYSELGKLTVDGIISIVESGPRKSTVYRITDKGHADLRTWIRTPEPRRERSSSALRVVLLQGLSVGDAKQCIATQITEIRSELARLEHFRTETSATDNCDPYFLAALAYRIRSESITLDWLQTLSTQGSCDAAEPEQ